VTDWQAKYKSLDTRLQQELARNEESEQLLCRAIVRLTIAVRGLDKRLDPHLVSLQKTAKQGRATPAFQQRLSELSDALVKASEDGEAVDGCFDLLERLVNKSGIQGKALSRLHKLIAQVADEPAQATDKQLDEILELLLPGRSDQANGINGGTERKGFLGKLLGGKQEAPAAQVTNQNLLELMQRLDWPSRLRSDIQNLQQSLESAAPGQSACLEVIEGINRAFSTQLGDVETELENTERFLAGLNQRLQELNQVLVQIGKAGDEAQHNGRILQESMAMEVKGVAQDAEEATDFEAFKQQLSSRLDSIQNQVMGHLKEEQVRHDETAQESQKMQGRLAELEAETQNLRQQLSEARFLANTDTLTGVPNRAAFERYVAAEFARWQRNPQPLTLLIWDIDHFKNINDNFGHQAGDKTLKVIGQLLAKRIRQTDFMARYGGEEFVMLMTGTGVDQALALADTLREDLAKQKFHAGTKPLAITISCGLTQFQEGDDPGKVFRRADAALYQAKQEGRNRCKIG
jgi:diguanylate cyclase